MNKHFALHALLITAIAGSTWTMAETRPVDSADEEQLKVTQEHLLKMHDLSTRILASKDLQQKERLKSEQRTLMRSFDQTHQHLIKNHLESLKKSQVAPK